MTTRIEVRLRKVRYSSTVPMSTEDVAAFLGQMEDFAANYLGIAEVTVSAPQNSESFLFEFEIGDD